MASLQLIRVTFIGYSMVLFSLIATTNSASIKETIQQPTHSSAEPIVPPGNTLTYDLSFPGREGSWFNSIQPKCNSLEAEISLRYSPPPSTKQGAALAGLCYALAGKFDRAEEIFKAVPDDVRADPLRALIYTTLAFGDSHFDSGLENPMKLILKFYPKHKLANFIIGLSQYLRGEISSGKASLEQYVTLAGNGPLRDQATKILEGKLQPGIPVIPLSKICPDAISSGEQC